jgi:hypothetical protein
MYDEFMQFLNMEPKAANPLPGFMVRGRYEQLVANAAELMPGFVFWEKISSVALVQNRFIEGQHEKSQIQMIRDGLVLVQQGDGAIEKLKALFKSIDFFKVVCESAKSQAASVHRILFSANYDVAQVKEDLEKTTIAEFEIVASLLTRPVGRNFVQTVAQRISSLEKVGASTAEIEKGISLAKVRLKAFSENSNLMSLSPVALAVSNIFTTLKDLNVKADCLAMALGETIFDDLVGTMKGCIAAFKMCASMAQPWTRSTSDAWMEIHDCSKAIHNATTSLKAERASIFVDDDDQLEDLAIATNAVALLIRIPWFFGRESITMDGQISRAGYINALDVSKLGLESEHVTLMDSYLASFFGPDSAPATLLKPIREKTQAALDSVKASLKPLRVVDLSTLLTQSPEQLEKVKAVAFPQDDHDFIDSMVDRANLPMLKVQWSFLKATVRLATSTASCQLWWGENDLDKACQQTTLGHGISSW